MKNDDHYYFCADLADGVMELIENSGQCVGTCTLTLAGVIAALVEDRANAIEILLHAYRVTDGNNQNHLTTVQ